MYAAWPASHSVAPAGASLDSTKSRSATQDTVVLGERLQPLLAVSDPPVHQRHVLVLLGGGQRRELDRELELEVLAPALLRGHRVGQVNDLVHSLSSSLVHLVVHGRSENDENPHGYAGCEAPLPGFEPGFPD